MTEHSLPVDDRRPIRATMEEYDLDGTSVVMLSDPRNEHAWIQSDVSLPNDP